MWLSDRWQVWGSNFNKNCCCGVLLWQFTIKTSKYTESESMGWNKNSGGCWKIWFFCMKSCSWKSWSAWVFARECQRGVACECVWELIYMWGAGWCHFPSKIKQSKAKKLRKRMTWKHLLEHRYPLVADCSKDMRTTSNFCWLNPFSFEIWALLSTLETHAIGDFCKVAKDSVNRLVTIQLDLTEWRQIILHLGVDLTIQHLQTNTLVSVQAARLPPCIQCARPHLDTVDEVCVIVMPLVSVSGRQR